MIRLLILIFLTIIFLRLQGQETERIIKYFHKSKQIMEEYDVLKSDKNIKHGFYARYYRATYDDYKTDKDKYLQKQGFYNQNKLDSVWTYYDMWNKGHRVNKEERYNNGQKTGIWSTVLEKGKVIKRYDYDKNIELEPIIKYYYIYPDRASEEGIEGVVEIFVKYNLDCKTDTIFVKKSANEMLEKNALNGVKEQEKLREKYSIKSDCSNKTDSTYVITYKLR